VSRDTITPGPLAAAYERACRRLDEMAFADALWSRRLGVWTSDAATQAQIANRLGWLGALDFLTPHLPRLLAFAHSVRQTGFTDVVLLGMGGSSLAPEVLRRILGIAPGFPRFRMLDSVDPQAVRDALEQAATSLFILASKSGSTIEPNSMAAEARRRVTAAGHEWGSRVVAITDENTALHQRATAERYRDIFINPTDIGGRYSALSFFGMVPAALMGADLEQLVAATRAMEAACRRGTAADNPGLALGALIASGVEVGRDKLTMLLPERLQSLGLWIEQLVAESTGKSGKGVVPIVDDPPQLADGPDRTLVAVTLPDSQVTSSYTHGELPIARIEMPGVTAIGAEFLRWEVATAAASVLMGVNPFDEPNVATAKSATRTILDRHAAHKRLLLPECHATLSGARLTLGRAAEERLGGASAGAFLRLLGAGDYFGLLAYLPPDEPASAAVLREFRVAVASATGCATMCGYGPRYLHSTGQLHKGGANNGVFVILTTDVDEDLPIPGESFSFGVLELAQALGDFQSLDDASRRVLHVHVPSRDPQVLQQVFDVLLKDFRAGY
jgi:glucose-6-phosphate isomerase/transaldolase/glucose-6-phosphate isomerase